MEGKMQGAIAFLINLLVVLLDGKVVKEQDLYEHLLRNYHANLRPVKVHTEVVNVTVDLGLTQIINMDEKQQVLVWNGWVRQSWNDFRLAWNLTEFGNLKGIVIDKESIWTPDMALYNNAKGNFQLLNVKSYEKIIVHHNGECLWLVPFVFQTICKIDVTYFPFDEQTCEFEVGSWAYTGAYLNTTHKTRQGDLSQYSQNNAWKLLNVVAESKLGNYSCCPEPYPSVIFKMHLKRRSLYYLYKVIIPSSVIAALAIISFFLPASSGERVALLMTNFVALSLFILMLSNIVPPTSDKTPLLEVYLTAVFIEISAALILRCSIDTAKRKNSPPGLLIRKFICYYLARVLGVQSLSYGEAVTNTDAKQTEEGLANIDVNIPFDVEVVRAIQRDGGTTEQFSEPIGVVNRGMAEDLLSFDSNRNFEIEGENPRSDHDGISDFQLKVLKTVESLSGSVKQRVTARIRQIENSDTVASLDKFFFCLFTMTIIVTVLTVFLTPPTVVL